MVAVAQIYDSPDPVQDAPISQQELANILAAMTQTLLEDVSKIAGLLAEDQQKSAEVAQDWVGVAKSNFDETKAAEKAYEDALNAQKNPPWWQQLINIVVKYVLPAVMCVIAGLAFGPAAFVITAAVILATTIPVKDGKSLVGLASSAIAKGLGSAFNLSPAAQEVAEGVINVTFAVVLAIAGGGAASACAAEAATEAAVAEEAENVVSSGASKLVGFNTFVTVTGNTNSWYDVAYGSFQVADSNSGDQEKGKLIATAISMVMNIIFAIASCGVGASSLSSTSGSVSEFFESQNLVKVQKFLNNFVFVALTAKSGSSVGQAFALKDLSNLKSEMTNLQAGLKFVEGYGQLAEQNSDQVNKALKSTLTHYDTMIGNSPNYAELLFTAAKEMQRCNRA